MAHYVYGIVEARAPAPDGSGIGGSSVRLIPGEGAAALVSELDQPEPAFGRKELLAHAHVLEGALSSGTVLPMRFGIVMEDEDEVRQRLLNGYADELRAQLERFADKVEVNIRASYEEEVLMREVVEANPEIARLRESLQGKPEDATYYDRIKLGELVSKAVERTREADSARILEALSPVAADVHVATPVHERVALNAAFLVERRRLKEFDEVLEGFAGAQAGRLQFKYTGPLPPHSFVELLDGS
ncbi:MAG TPA: GvpL/GvpF family gas vesicle protein [Solirubrobacteraceae bacterium]